MGIHPGSGENFPQRRWPIDRFAEVGARLHREYGARIVFTGTPAETGADRGCAGPHARWISR